MQLRHAHQRRAKIEVVQGQSPAPRPASAPSLAIALKGQAMDRAIQQATELGTQGIWLLQGARSNLALKQDRSTKNGPLAAHHRCRQRAVRSALAAKPLPAAHC